MQPFSPGIARRSFHVALAASVLLHLAVLFVPAFAPEPPPPVPARRLTVELAPRKAAPPPAAQAPAPSTAPVRKRVPTPQAPKTPKPPPVIASKPKVEAPPTPAAEEPPRFTATQKAEMDDFLRSLEPDRRPQPNLAQRSLGQAREAGRSVDREAARAREREVRHGPITIERIPDTPPPDAFSLEMYLDALVNKLNRTAAFVPRESRRLGYRRGVAQMRLNPDGTMRSFEVLNVADQQDQMAYVAALVNRAAPYPPFPPDIAKSARGMSIMICILPANESGDVGFARMPEGRGC